MEWIQDTNDSVSGTNLFGHVWNFMETVQQFVADESDQFQADWRDDREEERMEIDAFFRSEDAHDVRPGYCIHPELKRKELPFYQESTPESADKRQPVFGSLFESEFVRPVKKVARREEEPTRTTGGFLRDGGLRKANKKKRRGIPAKTMKAPELWSPPEVWANAPAQGVCPPMEDDEVSALSMAASRHSATPFEAVSVTSKRSFSSIWRRSFRKSRV
jgi:hypothetical protein